MPTLNIMHTHETVRNSGSSSSAPSLILPKRLTARNPAKTRKNAVETTKPHPKPLMIAERIAWVTEARLSGATAPHEMNPAVIAMAGQNTAGSMLRSLFVVDMLDLPALFRNYLLKTSPWTTKTDLARPRSRTAHLQLLQLASFWKCRIWRFPTTPVRVERVGRGDGRKLAGRWGTGGSRVGKGLPVQGTPCMARQNARCETQCRVSRTVRCPCAARRP